MGDKPEIENIEDHMAWTCECGSVKFNLLKSGQIECAGCQKRGGHWGMDVSVDHAKHDPVAEVTVLNGSAFTKHLRKLPDGMHFLYSAQSAALLEPAKRAYGWLWCFTTDNACVKEARQILRDALTMEQRKEGIEFAKTHSPAMFAKAIEDGARTLIAMADDIKP